MSAGWAGRTHVEADDEADGIRGNVRTPPQRERFPLICAAITLDAVLGTEVLGPPHVE